MKYYSEEIVKKLLDGMGPRELKFCPSIEITDLNKIVWSEKMDSPNFEHIEIIRKLNEASDGIRKELGHCRDDKENFSVNSPERISLEGRIDGLLISLKIIESIRNNLSEEWHEDLRG